MADTRLQAHWLNNPEFDDLDDIAWRVFTNGLMWCNGRGTDGHVPARYLKMLHPDGDKPTAYMKLIELGYWAKVGDGYQFLEWVKKLGQSTAEQVEHSKELNRQKQAKWRADQKKKLVGTPAFSDVTSDVTGYVTQDVGQDRTETGQAGIAEVQEFDLNEQTGEVTEQHLSPDSSPAASVSGVVRDGNKVRRVRRTA